MSFIRIQEENTKDVERYYVIEKDGEIKIQSKKWGTRADSLKGYTSNGWTVLCDFEKQKVVRILLEAQANNLLKHTKQSWSPINRI